MTPEAVGEASCALANADRRGSRTAAEARSDIWWGGEDGREPKGRRRGWDSSEGAGYVVVRRTVDRKMGDAREGGEG